MIHGDQLLNLTAKIRIHLVCEFPDHTSECTFDPYSAATRQAIPNLTTSAQALPRDFENIKT